MKCTFSILEKKSQQNCRQKGDLPKISVETVGFFKHEEEVSLIIVVSEKTYYERD
jgi:hypothetical protein